jgi:soluble cytochrome b562
MKLKDLLSEHVLGDLPSSKLIKMKWNPVTESHHEEEPVEEAAPRMRKDKSVDQLKTCRQIISGVENQIKSGDSSRYSHVKNDFNKFRKSIDNLIGALSRKGPTIPQ